MRSCFSLTQSLSRILGYHVLLWNNVLGKVVSSVKRWCVWGGISFPRITYLPSQAASLECFHGWLQHLYTLSVYYLRVTLPLQSILVLSLQCPWEVVGPKGRVTVVCPPGGVAEWPVLWSASSGGWWMWEEQGGT